MFMTRSFLTAAAILAASAALPAPAQSAARLPSALLPLSDADFAKSRETGCQFSFMQGRSTYIFMIGSDFLMRTKAGFALCKITDAQFQSLGNGRGAITCGGRKLAVRRTGKITANPEADSAVGPASLTMTEGGRSRTVRGNWGSAC